MNCAACGAPLPQSAVFCPKCGKPQNAGPSMSAPTPVPPSMAQAPSAPVRDVEGVRWVVEHQAAFDAWKKKVKFWSIPIAIIAALLVAVTTRRSAYAGAYAIVVFFVVWTILEAFVLPAYTFPTIPCPYCGQQVGIAERAGGFRWQATRACPYCKHELPH